MNSRAVSEPGGQDRRRLLFVHPAIEVANRSLRVDGHEAVRIMTKGTQTVMPPRVGKIRSPFCD